jgi:ketosteroid isomerase-like protein
MGLDAVRARPHDWFSSFDGPIDFENRDLSITRGDEIAFAHSLNHVRAR